MTEKLRSENRWRVVEMLAMKGWLETRWRLIGFNLAVFCMAINYGSRLNPATGRSVLVLLWMVLSSSMIMLAGSGIKSQAIIHISFPEGLAESTQFTISLPVSRTMLLTIRAGIGLLEAFVATVVIAGATWKLFPSISGSMTPADFVRLVFSTLLWLLVPYCAALLCHAFLAELWAFLLVGYGLTPLLWLLHKVSPAVDIIRIFGQASPALTHRLPLPQLATTVLLAMTLFLVTLWAVRRHEY
jgi:hypothetical protein